MASTCHGMARLVSQHTPIVAITVFPRSEIISLLNRSGRCGVSYPSDRSLTVRLSVRAYRRYSLSARYGKGTRRSGRRASDTNATMNRNAKAKSTPRTRDPARAEVSGLLRTTPRSSPVRVRRHSAPSRPPSASHSSVSMYLVARIRSLRLITDRPRSPAPARSPRPTHWNEVEERPARPRPDRPAQASGDTRPGG